MNRILTFYSNSHEQIYKDFFLPSFEEHLNSKFKLTSKIIPQVCESGEFAANGFDKAMLKKIEFIVENIDLSDKSKLVFSDCDVQFFGDIDLDMDHYDILFQKDYFEDARCAGFFICKNNQNVLNFFNQIKNLLENNLNSRVDDQFFLNNLIKNNFSITHGYLPIDKFWTVGNFTGGKVWNDGDDVQIPKTIVMHHANYTIGIENKIKLLNIVRDKMTQSSN